MTAFGGYARYYDLLYRDKDYGGEVEFVDQLIHTYAPGARHLLELGCGTGGHGVLFAERGYEVTGIDLSEEMLAVAAQRASLLPTTIVERLHFHQGDIRDIKAEGSFDVVLALFHVMSYLPDNDDLHRVFAGVKASLAPNGVFIFDCWYGPAVLTDRPVVRVKRLSDAETAVTRIATPTLYPNANGVDVHYQLFIRNLVNDAVEEVSELHRIRYLFGPELNLFAEQAGLRVEACGVWMSGGDPDCSTWYVYFVVRNLK